MAEELYNTILLVGGGMRIDSEIEEKFLEKKPNGWIIKDISLASFKALANRINPDAKIFIQAHGTQAGQEKKV